MTKTPKPVIRLRGVRQNNLKQVDLDLPLGELIVITGLSGSGKSSLAFETLFAEGQRRYIETFSPYARQFFDRMDKPRADRIEGIPPAIAIEQRNAVRTTRSTVGTMTEICDYTKLWWPYLAQLYCRQCGQAVRQDSPSRIWERVTASRRGGDGEARAPEVLITFPLPLSEKLSLAETLALIAKQGYQRLLLDGRVCRVEEAASAVAQVHPAKLILVQDRLRLTPVNRARFVEGCEQAYHFGKGRLEVWLIRDSEKVSVPSRAAPPPPCSSSTRPNPEPAPALSTPLPFSARLHCAACDLEYREATPALFSFNHPLGACPVCHGFGRQITIDYRLALPDLSKTLAEGVVRPWQSGVSAECQEDLLQFCRRRQVPTDVPFSRLSARHQDWVLNGDPDYGKDKNHEWPHAWYGVKGYFRWLESKAYKMHVRVLLSRYRAYETCPACQGQRFQPEALLFKVRAAAAPGAGAPTSPPADHGSRLPPPVRALTAPASPTRSPSSSAPLLSLADFYRLPIREALRFVEGLVRAHRGPPADPLALALGEVHSRLRYLVEVGLGYLSLDRPTRSLSGGETERVNLTTCLGTRLVNTLFVLDEPSVGLHPRDTDRLVRILRQLREMGNTVVVVEHEPGVMRAATQIVDLGPGSGEKGGRVVFQGPYAAILKSEISLTGQYLSGQKRIVPPARRPVSLPGRSRKPNPVLALRHIWRHNLKDLTVELPLGRFVCLTGVSGSGKTTLLREALLPAWEARTQAADKSRPVEQEGEPAEDREETTREAVGLKGVATLEGGQQLGRIILVDQSSLGKTPRSNPAVYIGAFADLRELFAQTDLARQRGLSASAFSFNSRAGQCERCRGAGFEKIEMQFLSDVYVRCPECDGLRYRPHILEVKLAFPSHSTLRAAHSALDGKAEGRRQKAESQRPEDSALRPPQAALEGKAEGRRQKAELQRREDSALPPPSAAFWSIADLLAATVDEVVEQLQILPSSRAAARAIQSLKLLQEVGLGYLRLGQPINTLSGGECQRLKLVRHLAEFSAGNTPAAKPTLFLFDEPTTGLHFDDVRVLLQVFQRLVDAGHSLVVIEHNLEVIKCADWLIDLGPEAGDEGGRIVVQGTPEQVAACDASHTGRALRQVLASG